MIPEMPKLLVAGLGPPNLQVSLATTAHTLAGFLAIPSLAEVAGGRDVLILVPILFLILVSCGYLIFLLHRRLGIPVPFVQRKAQQPHRSELAFIPLRDNAKEINETIMEAAALLSATGVKSSRHAKNMERFVFDQWQTERQLSDKFLRLSEGLIQILDFAESLPPAGGSAPDKKRSDAVKRYACQALEDVGISEIHTRLGEQFTGRYHEELGREAHALPAGLVVQVVRKGYLVTSPSRDEKVLRPVEVIVSAGPASATTATPSAGDIAPPAEFPMPQTGGKATCLPLAAGSDEGQTPSPGQSAAPPAPAPPPQTPSGPPTAQ